jgi:hypothetical protein
MVLFKLSHDVPANTTEQDPDMQKLRIGKGRIIGWIVFMTEQSADLLQLRVMYQNLQIFPFSGSTWWYGVFQAFIIPDDFPIPDSPYDLDIYAINTDDTFSHEYSVHVILEPAAQLVAISPTSPNWFEKLRDMFGGG